METNTTINELSDESLHIIFDYLDLSQKFKYCLVCKRWKQVMIETNFLKQKTIGIQLHMNEVQLINEYFIDLPKTHQNNKIIERWKCPQVVHHPKATDIISKNVFKKDLQNKIPFELISKTCPNLEAIDLREQTLDKNIISIIYKNCKKLQCIHLNFIKITETKVWDKLSYAIMPNVTHLSIDNTFDIENCTKEAFYGRSFLFFEDAKNLEDLAFNIYQMDSLFHFDGLTKLGSKICCAHFRVLPSIRSDYENLSESRLFIHEITENLLEGNGRFVRFLSLLTDEVDDQNIVQVIKSLRHFKQLIALHLSCKYNKIKDFKQVAKLQNIRSLTFDFYNLGKEQKISNILFNAKFRGNIERLKLRNGRMKGITFKNMVQCFPNLKRLELNDIVLINIEMSFGYISNLKDLNELQIEYYLKDRKNRVCDSLWDFLKFKDKKFEFIESIHKIIRKCQNLTKLKIKGWPGLGLTELQKCQMIANEVNKNLKFKFEFYENLDI